MQIRGLCLGDFELITYAVGFELFAGNLAVHADSADISGNRCRARVRVDDSHGAGARRSWSGRRGPYACWHAYRDVLAEVFQQFPHAVITTGLATYRGRSGFARHYPATGTRNIGSMVQPTTMPECCDCTHRPAVDMTGWSELPEPAHAHRTAGGIARCPDCHTLPESSERAPADAGLVPALTALDAYHRVMADANALLEAPDEYGPDFDTAMVWKPPSKDEEVWTP